MAITKKHTRNKDSHLDKGGANESTAVDIRAHLDDVTIHRTINDVGSSTTDLWSANKISTEISNAIETVNEIGELIDVTITAVVDNEILGFNSGSGEWINQTPAELGLSEIGHTHVATDITDFDTEVNNNTDVAANTAVRHSHANKALLDTYTQTEVDLADAVSKKHTQNSDTKLDDGQPNEVTAVAIRNILDTSLVTISTEQIANFTATKNALTPVDVTTIPITVTPPSSPVTGDTFAIVDSRFNAFTNNIIIDFTTVTQNLYGSLNNWIINEDGGYVQFIYINTSIGWIAHK